MKTLKVVRVARKRASAASRPPSAFACVFEGVKVGTLTMGSREPATFVVNCGYVASCFFLTARRIRRADRAVKARPPKRRAFWRRARWAASIRCGAIDDDGLG